MTEEGKVQEELEEVALEEAEAAAVPEAADPLEAAGEAAGIALAAEAAGAGDLTRAMDA